MIAEIPNILKEQLTILRLDSKQQTFSPSKRVSIKSLNTRQVLHRKEHLSEGLILAVAHAPPDPLNCTGASVIES